MFFTKANISLIFWLGEIKKNLMQNCYLENLFTEKNLDVWMQFKFSVKNKLFCFYSL